MAPRSLVLAALLVAVVAVGVPMPRGADAAGADLVIFTGQVPCSSGIAIDIGPPPPPPPFPYATVKIMCGGIVLTTVKTDDTGSFAATLLGDFGVMNRKSLLKSLAAHQCKAVVITPLVACNPALADAAGTLAAPLHIVEGPVSEIVKGLTLVAAGFFNLI